MRQLTITVDVTITTDDRRATPAELAEALDEALSGVDFDSMSGEASCIDSVDFASKVCAS